MSELAYDKFTPYLVNKLANSNFVSHKQKKILEGKADFSYSVQFKFLYKKKCNSCKF